ncbi:MAG: helix-turn-helix transcriptional regulator [Pseudomonadota bacterium]
MEHPLKKYRTLHSLSQGELAEKLECSKQTVCRIELGRRKPSIDLMAKIARVTNNVVTPNDLLFSNGGSHEDGLVNAGAAE